MIDTKTQPASSGISALKAFTGQRGPTIAGPDLVNPAMIRHWCAAMGERNPVYTDAQMAQGSVFAGIIAPPAMLQVWVMPGYGVAPPSEDPVAKFHAVANAQGYTSIVATNCEQEYLRPLRLGDKVHVTKVIESVSDEKKTALGTGVFLTTRFEFTDQHGQMVAHMLHRVLKFRPGAVASAPAAPLAAPALRPRPNLTMDNAFYFEEAKQHRLMIQRCTGCGRLRHPPTAACAHCGALGWEAIESAGRGTLFSYTIVNAPVVPPFKPGYVVGVVELEEGVRVVAEIVDVDSAAVHIGMPLEVGFLHCDADLVLPVFRPRAELPVLMQVSERAIGYPGAGPTRMPPTVRPDQVQPGARLAPLEVPMTRSYIVASAMATRDYQDVHHDHELARQRGSEDIFLNILTSTGLVARFVSDAFGPNAQLRKLAIRLGATAYPGATLTMVGNVLRKTETESGCDVVVAVRGSVSRGDHVTGEVTLSLLASAGGQS